MNTVASAAVGQINETNLKNAQASAIVIIKEVTRLQKLVEVQETNIATVQVELEKLANSEITLDTVYGKPMPAALNVTQQAVAKALETLVKSQQACVDKKATELGEAVIAAKKNISSLDEQIAKKQKELDELKVETVSESDVLN